MRKARGVSLTFRELRQGEVFTFAPGSGVVCTKVDEKHYGYYREDGEAIRRVSEALGSEVVVRQVRVDKPKRLE